jgi:hypothetical protein
MNIYLLTPSWRMRYDIYTAAVVIAESEEAARVTCPSGYYLWVDKQWHVEHFDGTLQPEFRYDWPNNPLDEGAIEVRLVGTALPDSKPGVVCASYAAG